jgi:hypothetical protein
MTRTEDLTVTMTQDDGTRTYECGPDSCGYDGDTYCQNCGYAADEDGRA